jgi:hypothetical protein
VNGGFASKYPTLTRFELERQWHEGPGKGNVMINIDEKVYDVPGSSTMIDSVIVI